MQPVDAVSVCECQRPSGSAQLLLLEAGDGVVDQLGRLVDRDRDGVGAEVAGSGEGRDVAVAREEERHLRFHDWVGAAYADDGVADEGEDVGLGGGGRAEAEVEAADPRGSAVGGQGVEVGFEDDVGVGHVDLHFGFVSEALLCGGERRR